MFIFKINLLFVIMKESYHVVLSIIFIISAIQFKQSWAQEQEPSGYKFSPLKVLNATDVKNQYSSLTCWSFSGISLLESELMRTKNKSYDLSEMFIVRYAYIAKAMKYVRMHGHINFTGGGEANDVIDVIKSYGIVPEEIYPAKKETLIHCKMDSVLRAYINNVINSDVVSEDWPDGYLKILDTYLGAISDTFNYEDEVYTSQGFAEKLGLNMDDYVLVTSFTHHPYYSKFILEVPDNWSWGEVYNVTLDDLVEIIDSAVYNGYTVLWSTDNSDKGFTFTSGLAIVPEIYYGSMTEEERANWDTLPQEIKDKKLFDFDTPGPEKSVTSEMRQEAFDNYTTTDDHGMHIVGLAEDQNKTRYYYVKNSWGTNNVYNGYMYISEPYVKYKTISIMLNKNAIPGRISAKLDIDK
jgi:bleomycin hydrolase